MATKGAKRLFHAHELRSAQRTVSLVREDSQVSAQSDHQTDGVRLSEAPGGTAHADQPQRVLRPGEIQRRLKSQCSDYVKT